MGTRSYTNRNREKESDHEHSLKDSAVMALREFQPDPVLKSGLSAAAVVVAVGAFVLVVVQMWRGDALVCAGGSTFADTSEEVTVIASDLPDGVAARL